MENNISEVTINMASEPVTSTDYKLLTDWKVDISDWMVCGVGTSAYWDQMISPSERKSILRSIGTNKIRLRLYTERTFDNLPEHVQDKISEVTDSKRWYEYNTKTGKRRKLRGEVL